MVPPTQVDIIIKIRIMKEQVLPAEGKLGILLPGLGAVASTMIAGVIATKEGLVQANRIAYPNRSYRTGEVVQEIRFP